MEELAFMDFNSIKTNFHTHTQFCDGKSTAEEMVLSAIEHNIKFLGFTSHTMFPDAIDDSYMQIRDYSSYCNEIRFLQKQFENEINISLGFEADYIPGKTVPSFEQYKDFSPDYLIGSIHFVTTDSGVVAPVDWSRDVLLETVKNHFEGDIKKCVGRYFEAQRQMLRKGDFTILGHCDLINKYNVKKDIFDPSEEWYKSEVKALIEEIKRNGCIVEINTGAIARGYGVIYPSEYIISLLYENNIPVTINSDCHNAPDIDCAFELAEAMIKKAGYKEKAIPYAGSVKFIKL